MFQLYEGDCFEHFAKVPDGSVHLILADLPYGTTLCSWDSILPLDKLWTEYKRVLTPTGAVVLTCAQPFTTVLAASNLPWLKYSLVWQKNRPTGFLQAKQRPLKTHEDILVFSPGTIVSSSDRKARNMTYNPQGLIPLEKKRQRKNGATHGTFIGKKVGDSTVQEWTNYPTSILKFNSERGLHPTQKPLELFRYLVRTFSNPNETVLDNTMGSGTTGHACIVEDRHFIGMEMDPKYFAIAKQRIEDAELIRA